ncbi:MAG: ATP-binding protein [Polyangiales bacterium]
MTRSPLAPLALALAASLAAVALALTLAPAPAPTDPRPARRAAQDALARSLAEQWRNLPPAGSDPLRFSQRLEALALPLRAPMGLREAQALSPEGTVLGSVTVDGPLPRCTPRVVSHAVPSGRLVLTLIDDCDAPSPAGSPARAWGAALGVLALGFALAAWLLRQGERDVSGRVAKLVTAAERVGAGELNARVRPSGGDAVEALMRAFNQMAEELSLSRSRVDYLSRIAGWQDLARRLAHEIKNPLTPIQLAVQEVARKYPGDDERFAKTLATAKEVVEEEVATLRRLVGAFSEFARLPDVKPAAGDLRDFVREMETSRAFIDEAAGSTDVTVRFEAGEGALPVMIDRVMFRRAAENLVKNAVEAVGKRGGNVWVRCERREVTPPAEEGQAPRAAVSQAWLTIEDDGPGVAPAHREKVFDPYFTTKGDGGTGLGLAIVRKVALDHDGDVGLEERPGGGARFVLVLPVREPGKSGRLSFVTFTGATG